MTVRHIFFDIGGVLGSNGWDREQRAAAAQHFGLDVAEVEDRHGEAVAMLEQGRMPLDEYLRCTVFHRPRPFDAGGVQGVHAGAEHAVSGNDRRWLGRWRAPDATA